MEPPRIKRDDINMALRVCPECNKKQRWSRFYRPAQRTLPPASYFSYDVCESCRRRKHDQTRVDGRSRQRRLSGDGEQAQKRDDGMHFTGCERCGLTWIDLGDNSRCGCPRPRAVSVSAESELEAVEADE